MAKSVIEQYGDIKNGVFTDKHLKAAELLSKPKGVRGTIKEVAEEVGIGVRTLHKWRKEPKFAELVDVEIKSKSQQRMPNVIEALFEKAEAGSAKHIELIFKWFGYMTEKHEVIAEQRPAGHNLNRFNLQDKQLSDELNDLKKMIQKEGGTENVVLEAPKKDE
ncbi:phBC6A51 family helix-turn-helix protein [Jeotgalicoccus halotolerans]|uniref:Putative insertion element HTH domain-containing protein n=1 Tax=Jeotgalicoccus halotolerans TaxID=157227 RepID=A0A3E0AYN4_9STAP|nr:phBC6A51 family helix-turn-helix protein [Jeotgalicoccus halotolerans]REG23792.1 putative insertion element HTH domain-containing protein [Jeotgalicoccus halotolerans]